MDDVSTTPKPPMPDTGPIAPVPNVDDIDWTEQVLGEFRILHRLGRGGMGQVYLAEQVSLKRKVALKLLNPDLASNQRALMRFKSEAENVARATHANIVQIYTIGEAKGVHYIALEYVEGKNLGEFILKKGTPELPLGLHIMTQVASALQRANELGLVHRDIKPENILLTKKGEVKVADFGLSRDFAEGSTQPSLTLSQMTMGTPLYMSPEQVERKPVDGRTDIYAFGVTCYHMFAGTPPFRGNSPVDVAYKHVHEEPQPLEQIRPDLPGELCAIIHKMMAKKPEERYQTAREILRDINRLCDALNVGTSAVSISATFLNNSAEILRNSGTATLPETPPTRTPWSRIFAALSVLVALGAGLGLGWHHHLRDAAHKNGRDAQIQPLPVDPFGQTGRKQSVDEKALKQLVDEYANAQGTTQIGTGVEAAFKLGAFYVRENRLDDAEKLFESLNRGVPAYRLLGQIGEAIVLAYRDEHAKSNKLFLVLADEFKDLENPAKKFKKDKTQEEKILAYKIVWKESAPLRELAAQALNRNFINDPLAFSDEGEFRRLNVYRTPPRPTIKPAPKDPTPMTTP